MTGYLRGGYRDRWPTIGLGVMATQASAITFLSTPGQAYEDGMRFVQFYFGLPLAMVILSVAFVPLFYRLARATPPTSTSRRASTCKTRQLAALLFLLQRGPVGRDHHLRAGHHALDGARLAAQRDLPARSARLVDRLHRHRRHARGQPDAEAADDGDAGRDGGRVRGHRHAPAAASCRFGHALARRRRARQDERRRLLARPRQPLHASGRGSPAASSWRWPTSAPTSRRCSATCPGARSTESRLGLLFNGLFKVPMQFLILFVGVMVFVFYQFNAPPLFFNEPELARVAQTPHAGRAARARGRSTRTPSTHKRAAVERARAALDARRRRGRRGAQARRARRGRARRTALREQARALIAAALPRAETKDADYVFLSLRHGQPAARAGRPAARGHPVRGHVVDGQRADGAGRLHGGRLLPAQLPAGRDRRALPAASPSSPPAAGGSLAVAFAGFASLLDNLIQAVNILGSLFYGTILGIFLVAFFFRRLRGDAGLRRGASSPRRW